MIKALIAIAVVIVILFIAYLWQERREAKRCLK
jgi:FtsZ-interacting cell division protein ZipA